MSETHAIRILNQDGTFHAYLSNRNRTAWSKRQAQRHVKHAKTLPHFKDKTFKLEPN